MASWFPRPPERGVVQPEPTGIRLDVSQDETRRRWAVRAAQWRAVELARDVFQGPVEARLISLHARGKLQGLLDLTVPWKGLEDHETRTERFLALAGADPLLAGVPLLFAVGPPRG
ncbi:MAG: hypothetical protein ACE5GJ_05505 [Gemmatimonadota bacterium]